MSRGRLSGCGKGEAKQITIAKTFIYKLLGAPAATVPITSKSMGSICHQMFEIMGPHLLENPILSSCLVHKNQICELIIITATLKPVLDF
jgi:hypothetical protein